MELVAVGLLAVAAAGLTLFSGFGLGTILLPAFALLMPAPVAVAATAVVHFATNLLKFGLLARQADWGVAWRFGIPAVLASFGGAFLLAGMSRLAPAYGYELGGRAMVVSWTELVIGVLIVGFAVLELSPKFQALEIPAKWLPVGGVLSGFFGGLSGNQGALRSAFLLKAGLSKEAFVATGVVGAVMVDTARLAVYGPEVLGAHVQAARGAALPVLVGCICAFAGTLLANKMLKKVSLNGVRITVAVLMILVGIGLASGVV